MAEISENFQICKILTYNNKRHYFDISNITKYFEFCVSTEKSLMRMNLNDDLNLRLEEPLFVVSQFDYTEEKHVFDVDTDREDLHSSLPIDQGDNARLCTLMLDSTLSPLGERTVTIKQSRVCQLSPAKSPYRAVIAMLTIDHRLQILKVEGKRQKLVVAIDLSDQFSKSLKAEDYAILSSRLEGCPKKLLEYNAHEQRTYAMAAVELAWGPVWQEDGGDWCYLLVVGMRSGHLVLWKINMPLTLESAELLEFVDTGNELPTAMHFARVQEHNIVFVGFHNGQMKSYTVTQQGQDCELLLNTDLWQDRDQLIVDNISFDPKSQCVLFSKGPYVMLAQLSAYVTTGVLSVVSQTEVLLTAQASISGIHYAPYYNLLSTKDGNIYRFIVQTDPELKLHLTEMNVERPTFTKWKLHGCRLSNNRVYLVENCSPNLPYDHLTVKMPQSVHVIQLQPIEQVYDMLNHLSERTRLCNINDILVCIRCEFSKSKRKEFAEPVKSWMNEKGKWPEYPIVRLKLVRYFVMIKLQEKPDQNSDEEINKAITRLEVDKLFLEELILVPHVVKSLQSLTNYGTPLDLKEKERTSAQLLCKFAISRDLEGAADLTQRVCDVTGMTQIPEVLDKCAICQSNITTSQVMGESCPNGHKIERCCQTFLLCQEVPYRACATCHVLAHSPSPGYSWMFDVLQPRCTFCDGFLL